MNKILTTALVAVLAASPALAALPVGPAAAAPSAETPRIETQVPGNTSGAVFVNFGRMFSLYGDLIQNSRWYKQALPHIQAGFPNPGTDIQQVGLVANLEDSAKYSLGLVSQGSVKLEKLIAYAAHYNLSLTPSVYQGVSLFTTKVDRVSAQLGLVNEATTLVSVDRVGEHTATRAIVATLNGQADSFATTTGLALPGDYIAQASLKMTDALRAEIPGNSWKVVRDIDLARALITADEATKDGHMMVAVTSLTEQNAQIIHGIVQQASAQAAQFFTQFEIKLEGKTVTVQGTMRKEVLEELLSM